MVVAESSPPSAWTRSARHPALHLDLGGAQAGLSFVAVTAGLFGVAEVLATVAEPSAATPVARVRLRQLYPSREEMRRAVPPMLRGTAVGFLVGLIPGPAATIASFASYGVERRVSRHGGARARRDRGVAGPGPRTRGGRAGISRCSPSRPSRRRPPSSWRIAARRRHPLAFPIATTPRSSGCDAASTSATPMLLFLNLPLSASRPGGPTLPAGSCRGSGALRGRGLRDNNIPSTWVCRAAWSATDPASATAGAARARTCLGPLLEARC